MYILAIETTGAYASVALLQAEEMGSGRILGVIHGNDRFSHLQNLTPQIEQILRESALSIGDMTAIAVSHGPGSFTGIRIGVSTARALSQVLNIPCIAVSSLEALALRAKEQTAARELICPVLDARRKQVYGAVYEMVCGEPVCRIEPASCLMTEFLAGLQRLLAGEAEGERAGEGAGKGEAERAGDGEAFREAAPVKIVFLGDGIDTCGDIIAQWEAERTASAPDGSELSDSICGMPQVEISLAAEEIRYQDAAAVALRGLQLYREGKSCDYMDLQPEYLRMAEAEKKLRDRQAAAQAAKPSGEDPS